MTHSSSPERSLTLIPHPNTPPGLITAVEVAWSATDHDEALLTFTITGAGMLALPEPATPARADGLWKTTCFELFWKPDGGDAYVEMNFSPSGRWAAYAFDGHRTGMREHPMTVPPHIAIDRGGDRLTISINVDFATLPSRAASIGLTAVIEETDGTTSYWALAHAPGPPDFHDARCFAMRVPAVGTP